MAHGYLSPTDVRGQSDLLGDIASAIGSRIKKSSDMARSERAYAKKQAENSPDNADFKGPPRGFFFKRALGSSFGGDRIARTRGRFETDPPAGRDPTGTQASRFRGGFDYTDNSGGVAPDSGSGPAGLLGGGGGPSGILGGGGGGIAQRLIGAGSEAINPEILGGEITQYKGTKTNAAGFTTVNTTATEVKDLAGILNQIGQLIVQTSNSSITAIDGVQRVNVKVVESVQSLGQLQVSIAEKQLAQQRQLAAASENFQEKMIERQRIAAEKSQFTEDDFSGATTAEKGYGFGGRLGALFGGGMNLLGDGLDFMSGRYMNRGVDTGRQRGARRRLARRRIGGARRGALSRMGGARKALTGAGAKAMNKGLQKTGVKIAGKGLAKGLGKAALKKIPGVGLIAGLGFGVERLLQGDLLGAGLELASGAASTVPGLGTAGSVGLDAVLAARDMGVTPFATGGIIDDPTMGLVGEKGREGVFPLEGAEGRKTFRMFGEGILEAQRNNSKTYANLQAQGIGQYFDKKNGWERFVDAFIGGLGKVGEMLKGTPLGFLAGLLGPQNNDFKTVTGDNNPDALPQHANYTGNISGNTFNPLPGGLAGKQPGQEFGAPRDGGAREHAGIDLTEHKREDSRAPVVAYKTGKVVKVSNSGGSPGGRVEIRHPDGFTTKYLHVTPRSGLKEGDQVAGGQHIGNLYRYFKGETEMTHLHFEVYNPKGELLNPTRFVNEARNNISNPLTDEKARELAGISTPETPVVETPESAAGPQETAGEKRARIDNQLKHIKQIRGGFTDMTAKLQEHFAPIVKEGRSSKSEEDFDVPGVGKIRYFNNGFIKKYTYFDNNGKEVSSEEFMKAVGAEDKRLQEEQVRLMNERPDQRLSSASTQPEVLQASAIVSANERQSQLQPAIVTMPIQESQQSSGSSQPIMASTMAGASGAQITPGWLLNSVLT